ncbi:DedA family protein [Acidianus sp. HS-5]|uniref:DedA family protein n=1 Tax=Acidianus sp. HS-5 TaxID=2886040 RepID=UPI001F2067F2|nr:DedA family protein [Acidianus sp. HS-5]BDC18498.1 DedA family protein [Acidianus sp. HS-5]
MYEFTSQFSYVLIFVLMVLEGMSLPIPSEIIMPLVGYYSFKGDLNIEMGIISGTLGSLIGSIIDYFIAEKLGIPFLSKYGKIFGINESKLFTLSNWFAKYGIFAVFGFRFIPLFRALISFPAGLAKMKIIRFLLATFSGHMIWNSVLALIGYEFSTQWEIIISQVEKSGYVIAGIAVFAIVIYIIISKRR